MTHFYRTVFHRIHYRVKLHNLRCRVRTNTEFTIGQLFDSIRQSFSGTINRVQIFRKLDAKRQLMVGISAALATFGATATPAAVPTAAFFKNERRSHAISIL